MRISEASRKTKISKLDFAVLSDQQVVWLDITMENKVLVTEPDSAGQHAHPGFDVCSTVTDGFGIADEHFQVASGQVLENEVEVLVFGGEDGEERDDVWMRELLKMLQFADGVGGHAFVIFFLDLDLLDSDEGAGL